MAEKTRVMGLSLTDKTVQAVEIEQDGPSNTLTAVDEWVNTLPSSAEQNGEGTQKFVEFLSTFMKTNQVKAKLTSVALDSSLLFFNTIPLEEGLSRAEINDHVNWELAEYFPETPSREFITDTHVLTRQ